MAPRGTFPSPSVAFTPRDTLPERDDLECVVCFNEFSTTERTPRLLHCGHTFCIACLDKISTKKGAICTISCPMCRWITCTDASRGLDRVLPINRGIWDYIPTGQKEEVMKATKKVHKSVGSKIAKTWKKTFSCGPKLI